MLRAALVVTLAALLAGFSLAFGLDPSEYTWQADDAGADAAPRDAGGRDAAPRDVDAPPTSPCATPHLFCDDFDDPRSLDARGWGPYTTDGGTIDIDALDARSAPRSLVATMQGAHAQVSRTFDGVDPAGDTELAFDVRVGAHVGSSAIAALTLGDGYLWRLLVNDDGVTYVSDEWGPPSAAPFPMTVRTQDAWVHVEMKLHFVPNQAAGTRGTILFDGQVVLEANLQPNVPTGTPGAAFGLIDGIASATYDVRFDNVTFDHL